MSPIRMAKLEFAIRVVLSFHDAFNRHDVAGMLDLISDDCVFEDSSPAPDGTVYSGKQAIAQFWQDFFGQPAQARLKIEEVFGLGNRCILRWRYDWVDPLEIKGHIRGIDIFQVQNGRISEKLSYTKASGRATPAP